MTPPAESVEQRARELLARDIHYAIIDAGHAPLSNVANHEVRECIIRVLNDAALRSAEAAQPHMRSAEQHGAQEAAAWQKGYRQGVLDERTSEANIGIAGFGAKVEPARNNPYALYTTPQPAVDVDRLREAWLAEADGSKKRGERSEWTRGYDAALQACADELDAILASAQGAQS